MAGHGRCRRDWRSPEYISWRLMKSRCLNPRATRYARYGGRGIGLCDRWLVFENFLADMGARPRGHTLERLDSDRDYSPDNCTWATHRQQTRNRAATRLTLDAAVAAVRARDAGESNVSIGRRLGVSPEAISGIFNGRRWPEARDMARAA